MEGKKMDKREGEREGWGGRHHSFDTLSKIQLLLKYFFLSLLNIVKGHLLMPTKENRNNSMNNSLFSFLIDFY